MDGISFTAIDPMQLLEKVGTLGVIIFFGIKVVYNDLAHLQASMNNIEKLCRLMVRLQAESMGKNPDIIEAQTEVPGPTSSAQ